MSERNIGRIISSVQKIVTPGVLGYSDFEDAWLTATDDDRRKACIRLADMVPWKEDVELR